jgi:integrase
VRLGQIEANRAKGVRKLASVPRARRLSRNEIERLGKTLRAVAEEGEHSTALAAIRFLLLTDFRRMEALGLQRAWLGGEDEAIRFPDAKSGAQTSVIGRAAIERLPEQPKTKSSFFFPADWDEGILSVVRVLDRVCEMARLVDVTPQTFRHTFASLADDLGFSERTIAALLGHSARGVTQRYIHIDEALRMTADRVAAEMADIFAAARRHRVSARGVPM